MTDEGEEIVDVALDQLMDEFHDLDLKRQQADRDGHRWRRETRWTRLVRWLKAHPGEEVHIEGIHANAKQRLQKRYPGLVVVSSNNRYLDKPEWSQNKRGKKVCDLHIMWPKGRKPEA